METKYTLYDNTLTLDQLTCIDKSCKKIWTTHQNYDCGQLVAEYKKIAKPEEDRLIDEVKEAHMFDILFRYDKSVEDIKVRISQVHKEICLRKLYQHTLVCDRSELEGHIEYINQKTKYKTDLENKLKFLEEIDLEELRTFETILYIITEKSELYKTKLSLLVNSYNQNDIVKFMKTLKGLNRAIDTFVRNLDLAHNELVKKINDTELPKIKPILTKLTHTLDSFASTYQIFSKINVDQFINYVIKYEFLVDNYGEELNNVVSAAGVAEFNRLINEFNGRVKEWVDEYNIIYTVQVDKVKDLSSELLLELQQKRKQYKNIDVAYYDRKIKELADLQKFATNQELKEDGQIREYTLKRGKFNIYLGKNNANTIDTVDIADNTFNIYLHIRANLLYGNKLCGSDNAFGPVYLNIHGDKTVKKGDIMSLNLSDHLDIIVKYFEKKYKMKVGIARADSGMIYSYGDMKTIEMEIDCEIVLSETKVKKLKPKFEESTFVALLHITYETNTMQKVAKCVVNNYPSFLSQKISIPVINRVFTGLEIKSVSQSGNYVKEIEHGGEYNCIVGMKQID